MIDKIEKLDRKIIQIGWIFLDLLLDIHLKRQSRIMLQINNKDKQISNLLSKLKVNTKIKRR